MKHVVTKKYKSIVGGSKILIRIPCKESISFEKLMERLNAKSPGGIVYHYMSYENFKSMLDGEQLRLTRYDRIALAPDEGKQIFRTVEEIVEGLKEDGFIDSEESKRIMERVESMKDKPLLRRYRPGEKLVECTPYVICFTRLDFNEGESEAVRYISGRDLRLELHLNNLELDVPGLNDYSDMEKVDCYGSVEIMLMNYEKDVLSDEMKDELLDFIRMYRNQELSFDNLLNYVERLVDCNRVFSYPSSYSDEMEIRLAFYVPNDRSIYPEISDVVKKKRTRNENNEVVECSDEIDESHIYLNFSNEKKSIRISINPESNHTVDEYNDMIRGAGFEPLVFNPMWPKV